MKNGIAPNKLLVGLRLFNFFLRIHESNHNKMGASEKKPSKKLFEILCLEITKFYKNIQLKIKKIDYIFQIPITNDVADRKYFTKYKKFYV